MTPPGDGPAVLVPRRLSRRERRLVGGVAGAALLLAVGVLVALLSASHTSAAGCIDFSYPYSVGGAEVYRCGTAARAICRRPEEAGNGTPQTAEAVRVACRRAGLPVA